MPSCRLTPREHATRAARALPHQPRLLPLLSSYPQRARRSTPARTASSVAVHVAHPSLAPLLPPCRPFRQWYEAHYGTTVGKKQKKKAEGEEETKEEVKKSKSVMEKIAKRADVKVLDPNVNSQFDTGRLLACVSSRPGQCGRCDGFILEGKELEFYVKRMARKKK